MFFFLGKCRSSKSDRVTGIQALSSNLIEDALSLANCSFELANAINQRLWKEGHRTNQPETDKDAMVATVAIDYWIFNTRYIFDLATRLKEKNGLKGGDKKRDWVYEKVVLDGTEYFAKKMGEMSGESRNLWSKVILEKANLKQQIFVDMPLICDPKDNAKTRSALNWTMADVAKILGCESNALFWYPMMDSALKGLHLLNKSRSELLLLLL